MTPSTTPKPIFKSKTAVASALVAIAGALGSFFPDANKFISENANSILVGLGILGVILRMATKGRVTLFPE